MESNVKGGGVSKGARWTGYVMSAIPAAMLLMGAVMDFTKPEQMMMGMKEMGYPESVATPMGIATLACVVFYLIPKTAPLGAILMTGYLGGAVATHVRVGQPFYFPVVVGVLVWGGLYMRDRRIRALIPFRS